MKNTNTFLQEHKIRATDVDMQQLVDLFTREMQHGLAGDKSSLMMIPTYIEADNQFATELPVLAIDAGGTNFRAARVWFTKDGKLEIADMIYDRMPGIDGEVSRDEFFKAMAGYIESHAKTCERIGFCFSYATEIYPNKDGKLLNFSKEVQAPGVIGEMIGARLLEALGMPEKPIVLLNDTVATLLAGKSASFGKAYDSFIGFILGTGTNTCYIETNANILKKTDLNADKSMIINIESGNFGKAPRTDIDIAFDNTTSTPGKYTFEKMFSGGYFGGLCLAALKQAATEGVFSAETAAKLLALSQLTAEEANQYVTNADGDRGVLKSCLMNHLDEEACAVIIETLIERAAKLVAANLAAVLLKTNKGKDPERPILLTIEGTTFYKMYKLQSLFEKYFFGYLSGDNQRYAEFIEVHQSSLVGAALSALID